MVKVRFAPSPTGFLHIGGARTALFNWLFARHNQGEFLLRIEDTDRLRSERRFLDEILESLKWLGLDWDGEPIFQSERLGIYKRYAQLLVEKGLAQVSEGAVIFKMPQRLIAVNDLIHGEIQVDTSTLKDLVIIKSDGFPTYNFACVIDDAAMGITHIIRGDDHISNTPKQIPLYEALGFSVPQFAHIPLIMGEEGGRLSKRTGAVALSDFRKMGYLSDALVNYLALLGWSPGGDREILSREEIIKTFSLDRVGCTSAAFNTDKLNWLNSMYIRGASDETLIVLILPQMEARGYKSDPAQLRGALAAFKERMERIGDFVELAGFLFRDEIEYDAAAQARLAQTQNLASLFSACINALADARPWTKENIEAICRGVIAALNIKGGELIHPMRAALTGKTVGPGLFEVMELLGRDKTIARLGRFM